MNTKISSPSWRWSAFVDSSAMLAYWWPVLVTCAGVPVLHIVTQVNQGQLTWHLSFSASRDVRSYMNVSGTKLWPEIRFICYNQTRVGPGFPRSLVWEQSEVNGDLVSACQLTRGIMFHAFFGATHFYRLGDKNQGLKTTLDNTWWLKVLFSSLAWITASWYQRPN